MAILHVPLDALLPFAHPDNFKLLGQGSEEAWGGALGGVNLALEQLEEVIMLNPNTLVAFFDCPSTQGLKSCSASRLSRFPSKSWMARLVNRLQRCQVDFGSLVLKRNSHLEVSLNQSLQLSISFRFDNFGLLYYYHEYCCPPPLHVTKGASKENKAAHEAKIYHV